MTAARSPLTRNYSGGESDGIASEGGFEGVHQAQSLFADGRNVAADHTKPLRPFLAAETAGYLLLHFDQRFQPAVWLDSTLGRLSP